MNSTTTCAYVPASTSSWSCATVYNGFTPGELVAGTFLFFIFALLLSSAIWSALRRKKVDFKQR